MAISGLVITFSDDSELAEQARMRLGADPRLTLGEPNQRRQAAVAETPDVAADRALFDELLATPGVTHVDVAFVDFGSQEPSATPSPETCKEDVS